MVNVPSMTRPFCMFPERNSLTPGQAKFPEGNTGEFV
jgi:hypothetical protein